MKFKIGDYCGEIHFLKGAPDSARSGKKYVVPTIKIDKPKDQKYLRKFSVHLVIDKSASMDDDLPSNQEVKSPPKKKIEQAKKVASSIVDYLFKTVEDFDLSISAFSVTTERLYQKVGINNVKEKTEIIDCIGKIETGSGTKYIPALKCVANIISEKNKEKKTQENELPHQEFVFFITDGEPYDEFRCGPDCKNEKNETCANITSHIWGEIVRYFKKNKVEMPVIVPIGLGMTPKEREVIDYFVKKTRSVDSEGKNEVIEINDGSYDIDKKIVKPNLIQKSLPVCVNGSLFGELPFDKLFLLEPLVVNNDEEIFNEKQFSLSIGGKEKEKEINYEIIKNKYLDEATTKKQEEEDMVMAYVIYKRIEEEMPKLKSICSGIILSNVNLIQGQAKQSNTVIKYAGGGSKITKEEVKEKIKDAKVFLEDAKKNLNGNISELGFFLVKQIGSFIEFLNEKDKELTNMISKEKGGENIDDNVVKKIDEKIGKTMIEYYKYSVVEAFEKHSERTIMKVREKEKYEKNKDVKKYAITIDRNCNILNIYNEEDMKQGDEKFYYIDGNAPNMNIGGVSIKPEDAKKKFGELNKKSQQNIDVARKQEISSNNDADTVNFLESFFIDLETLLNDLKQQKKNENLEEIECQNDEKQGVKVKCSDIFAMPEDKILCKERSLLYAAMVAYWVQNNKGDLANRKIKIHLNRSTSANYRAHVWVIFEIDEKKFLVNLSSDKDKNKVFNLLNKDGLDAAVAFFNDNGLPEILNQFINPKPDPGLLPIEVLDKIEKLPEERKADLQKELDDAGCICPIGAEVMIDPVSIPDIDGQSHVYDREYIQAWIDKCKAKNIECTSPFTRKKLMVEEIKPSINTREKTGKILSPYLRGSEEAQCTGPEIAVKKAKIKDLEENRNKKLRDTDNIEKKVQDLQKKIEEKLPERVQLEIQPNISKLGMRCVYFFSNASETTTANLCNSEITKKSGFEKKCNEFLKCADALLKHVNAYDPLEINSAIKKSIDNNKNILNNNFTKLQIENSSTANPLKKQETPNFEMEIGSVIDMCIYIINLTKNEYNGAVYHRVEFWWKGICSEDPLGGGLTEIRNKLLGLKSDSENERRSNSEIVDSLKGSINELNKMAEINCHEKGKLKVFFYVITIGVLCVIDYFTDTNRKKILNFLENNIHDEQRKDNEQKECGATHTCGV